MEDEEDHDISSKLTSESSQSQKSQATQEQNWILEEIEARKLVADVAAGGEH